MRCRLCSKACSVQYRFHVAVHTVWFSKARSVQYNVTEVRYAFSLNKQAIYGEGFLEVNHSLGGNNSCSLCRFNKSLINTC